MNVSDELKACDRVTAVLERIRKKGVRLWVENGELRYRAPRGALIAEDIEQLRVCRQRIVTLLHSATGGQTAEPKLAARERRGDAPLTYSQLAYWHNARLGEQASVRQLAAAVRLQGRLHVDVLRRGLKYVVRRHEALRTRVIADDGVPVQRVDDIDFEPRLEDLSAVPAAEREVAVAHAIDELILEPIRVSAGPLFAACLVRLGDDEHVLITATHHIVSDGYSMNVFARDLFTVYGQLLCGHEPALPVLSVQFADYAAWQREVEPWWLAKHGAYWRERLIGCHRLRFPQDQSLDIAGRTGWSAVPLAISRDMKAALFEWSKSRHTTLVMSVFTAYAALVLRWCDAAEAVLRYQIDGRLHPAVENTIGYFAAVLHLRIAVRPQDSWLSLLDQVIQEYCRSYEHVDLNYIEAQLPRPDYVRNGRFNWVPLGREEEPSDRPDLHGLALAPISFQNPALKTFEIDSEPSILLYETEEEIAGAVLFPAHRFSDAAMAAFARDLLACIRSLLSRPEALLNETELERMGQSHDVTAV